MQEVASSILASPQFFEATTKKLMQSVGIERVRFQVIDPVDVLFLHWVHRSHSNLGVEHSLSKRKVVGSNPACGYFFGVCNNKSTRDEDRTRDLVRVRHA